MTSTREFLVNLARARFLIPVQVKDGSGKPRREDAEEAVRFINITLKNGDVYRPIFADNMEFQKFRQQKKDVQAITMPFAGLKQGLPAEAKGYLLNPNGCQIVLQRPLIDQVLANFPDDVKKGTSEAMKLAQSWPDRRSGRERRLRLQHQRTARS